MTEIDRNAPTVLYVDDEDLALKYFARAVGSDFVVLTASSADAAIEILQNPDNRVAVLVTDFRMPGRDGGSLLRQIEAEYPHIVRILVTAYADKELLLSTVNSSEIFRILEKPLDLPKARNILRMACDRARDRTARQDRLTAIDETLGFLAHELNTPLATIVNFSSGVSQRTNQGSVSSNQQAEIKQAALAISDNAKYCFTVLSSFIDSVRNAGTSSIGSSDPTAQQLVFSLLDNYPLTTEQRAMIEVTIKDDFPITALSNCVALVLSSTLSNALRALSGRPTPMLHFSVSVDGGAKIRITDNGPGIAPEVLQHLMVDPITTHEATGGSGMGMIFCKRIMQSFGGNIEIQSIQDEKTTVTLHFPTNGNHATRSDQ